MTAKVSLLPAKSYNNKHFSLRSEDDNELRHSIFAEALKEVAEIATQLQSSLIRLENFQKLTELQRDLIGIENLTAPGRVSCYFVQEVLLWLVQVVDELTLQC